MTAPAAVEVAALLAVLGVAAAPALFSDHRQPIERVPA